MTAAIVERGAGRQVGTEGGAVALFGDLVAAVQLQAFEFVVDDEVDDARDGVGTVGGRCTAGQDVNALDEGERDVVEVDTADQFGGDDALAVQQDDVAVRTEAAKVDVACAAVAVVDAEPIDGTMPGISRRTSSATLFWASWIVSAVVTLTGAACVRFGLLMREPVTTMASLAGASSVAASCA